MRSAKPDTARGLFGLNQYYNTTLTQKIEKLLNRMLNKTDFLSTLSIFIYFFIIVSAPACFLCCACLRLARVVEAGDINIYENLLRAVLRASERNLEFQPCLGLRQAV